MVDGAKHHNMAMIDTVCLALEPLGDTLAILVNIQYVTATTPDGATTLSRNCQLPEGQRAFMQKNREVDVVSGELHETFKKAAGAEMSVPLWLVIRGANPMPEACSYGRQVDLTPSFDPEFREFREFHGGRSQFGRQGMRLTPA